MSDTPSDLASRAQAREDVAEPIHRAMCNDGWEDCVEWQGRCHRAADYVLDDLPRLAGLLGYVKREDAYNHAADIAHAEARWQTELYMRGASSSTETAERVTVVENSIRHFAGREVVTDAVQG